MYNLIECNCRIRGIYMAKMIKEGASEEEIKEATKNSLKSSVSALAAMFTGDD